MQKGEKMPEELRKKISLAKKGKPNIKMLGNRNGSGNRGRTFNKKTLKKMSFAKKGKPSNRLGTKTPLEVREKIRNSLLGKVATDEVKEKNRQGQYKRYLRINPNYIVATRNKRIAINGGFHSQGEWEVLKAQYNFTCPCCKKSEPNIILTKDHIISLLRGGSNNIENIQPLCKSCNCKKHTQIIKY